MSSQQTKDLEAKFEKRLTELAATLRHARTHLDLATKIDGYRADHLAELNVAPAFWSYTIRAHLHAGILAVAKLLDERRGSLSLHRFLRFAQSNPQLFSRESFARRLRERRPQDSEEQIQIWLQDYKGVPDHKAHIEKVENVKNLLPNLIKWRDKVVAHIDEAFIKKGQPVGQVYPLSKSDVHSAIGALEEVLRRYYGAYNNIDYIPSMSFVGKGLERVMDALEKWRSARASG